MSQPLQLQKYRALLLIFVATGCVVTTYEGAGDPPRVAPSPVPIATSPRPEPSAAAPIAAKSSDAGPDAPEETVEASHILIAYRGSLRAGPTIVRTKEEALARAREVLALAKKGEDFGKLAGEYSDEPRAAERGGSIGSFPRNAVVKEFADAAFALKPGELSDVVETPFGYHVILRTK